MKKSTYILCLLSVAATLLTGCDKMGMREESQLEIPDKKIELDGSAQTFTIKINTNTDFRMGRIDVDWLRPVDLGTKAVEQIQETFEVDENNTGYTRQTKILLHYHTKDGERRQKKVEITQTSLVVNTTCSILFAGEKFVVPRLDCYYNSPFEGTVKFGDGTEHGFEPGLEHLYAQKDAYSILIEGKNAYKIKFENISGLEEIDLSHFGK